MLAYERSALQAVTFLQCVYSYSIPGFRGIIGPFPSGPACPASSCQGRVLDTAWLAAVSDSRAKDALPS